MKAIHRLLLGAALFAGATAHADLYIGAGAYSSSIDATAAGVTLDDSDVAPGFFLGWRPIELVGVEVGYYDFGQFDSPTVSAEGTAVTLAGLLSLELGPVGLYAKAGLADQSFDVSSGATINDDAEAFGGVGATFDVLDKLYVYAEYTRFSGDLDIDMAGAGVRYGF